MTTSLRLKCFSANWGLPCCRGFSAMRTRRSYQEPIDPHEIFNLLLSKAGSEFNPMLVQNFLQRMSRLKKL